MDGLSALPWTARWCQGTLPWPPWPQSVDKRCRRSHGRVERLAMSGPLVSRYLTLVARIDFIFYMALCYFHLTQNVASKTGVNDEANTISIRLGVGVGCD